MVFALGSCAFLLLAAAYFMFWETWRGFVCWAAAVVLLILARRRYRRWYRHDD